MPGWPRPNERPTLDGLLIFVLFVWRSNMCTNVCAAIPECRVYHRSALAQHHTPAHRLRSHSLACMKHTRANVLDFKQFIYLSRSVGTTGVFVGLSACVAAHTFLIVCTCTLYARIQHTCMASVVHHMYYMLVRRSVCVYLYVGHCIILCRVSMHIPAPSRAVLCMCTCGPAAFCCVSLRCVCVCVLRVHYMKFALQHRRSNDVRGGT